MRRAIIAVVLTISALYFVLSYKSKPITAVTAAQRPSASPPAVVTPAQTAAPTVVPSTPRTVTGSDIWTQYGDVQVQVTLSGGRITGISTLKMPFDHPRSQYISQTVAPWLKQEVMQAQSANIDTISGATYTSVAYQQSLQAALDRAHA